MRLILLGAFLMLFASCNKVICEKDHERDKDAVDGIVEWMGMKAVDGVEWVLRVNGKVEKPMNLPKEFEHHGLKVSVVYEPTTEKYPCLCVNGYIYMVRILSIKER